MCGFLSPMGLPLTVTAHAQETIVLDTKVGKEATQDILEAHSIPTDVSPDLRDLSAFQKAERLAHSKPKDQHVSPS